MGTNYYLHKQTPRDLCEHCGRGSAYEKIHIGKSSFGWKFLFATDGGEVGSMREWVDILMHPDNQDHIYNEYGDNITIQELLDLIDSKQDDPKSKSHDNHRYNFTDRDGFDFMIGEFS